MVVYLDSIFQALGTRGNFIKLQVLVFLIAEIPIAVQLLSNVFIGLEVPHKCARPENESQIWLVKPYVNQSNITISYGQCEIVVYSRDTVLQRHACLFGVEYELPEDTSFVSQFDLICDYRHLPGLSQTLFIVGQAVGAFFGSTLADRYGRKRIVVGSNILIVVFGFGAAFSPRYELFAACKFIIGIVQQAKLTSVVTWMLELLVIKDRRLATIFSGLFWTFGVVLLDGMAFCLKDYSWRIVQTAFTFTSVLALLEIILMKESLRWLLAKDKRKEASALIEYAGKMNGLSGDAIQRIIDKIRPDNCIDTNREEKDLGIGDDGSVSLNQTTKMSYMDLLKMPRYLLFSVIIWFAWMTCALGFFAFYLTATQLAGNDYLNFFLMAIMEIPPNILFYVSLNRFGRKTVMAFVFGIMSIGLIASGIFRSLEQNTVNATISTCLSMFGMFGAAGAYHLVFIYTPEIFPTSIRNQTVGIASMMSRIGGMLAPFTGILSDVVKWGPGVVLGVMAALVAVLMTVMPETNGRELPQTVEEFIESDKTRNRSKPIEHNKDATLI